MSIEQLPSGAWRISITNRGQRHRRTLPPGTSRRDAERAEHDLRTDIARNPATGNATVDDLLRRHIAEHGYAASTLVDMQRTRKDRIPDWFATLPVRDVTPALVDQLYSEMAAGGASPHRIRRVHELLGAAFSRARRWGWTSLAPTRDARPPRPTPRDLAPPDPATVARILADLDTRRFGLAIRVLAVTGMRRGEMIGLHWDDVNLDTGEIKVRRSITPVTGQGLVATEGKTGTKGHRVVVVDDDTRQRLARHRRHVASDALALGRQPGPFVFSSNLGDTPVYPGQVSRVFREARDAVGADRSIRLHDLRHYVATQMLAAGVDPVTVAGVLGHSTPATTLRVYAHYLPGKGAAAIAGIADGIAAADRQASSS